MVGEGRFRPLPCMQVQACGYMPDVSGKFVCKIV